MMNIGWPGLRPGTARLSSTWCAGISGASTHSAGVSPEATTRPTTSPRRPSCAPTARWIAFAVKAVSAPLRQIALNLVRSRARRKRRFPLVSLDPDTLPSDAATGTAPGQPGGDLDPLRSRLLRATVCELPEKQRRTLVLKIYEEMTHAEVARLMGCTIGTVKANLFHALRRLRRQLGDRR